jgi:2-dehydropantoate 2-reductase
MRFLVVGAGAIGAYIGGSLALHGHGVVFLVRPATHAALDDGGLRLTLPAGPQSVLHPRMALKFEEAFEMVAPDAVLFAVKSYDTSAALTAMQNAKIPLPPVVCLQNGVGNEALLAEKLGAGRVIAGTVTTSVSRLSPGEILVERLRGVGIFGGHSLSLRLFLALERAGLQPKLFDDPSAMKWSKLLTNLPANATAAILNMTPSQVYAHPGLFRLERAQLREALDVMAARKLRVVDLPGTPVRAMAFAVKILPEPLGRPILQRAIGGGRGEKMPSFHIDLHAGRGRSEVGYLNGAVAQQAALLGLLAPANFFLTETLQAITEGRLPLETYQGQPERLLEAWRASRPGKS